MELIHAGQIQEFSNSGVTSRQLLFPENSASSRLTITRVTITPGSNSPLHHHPTSEQVWIALNGEGNLLLEAGRKEPFATGDIVRFEDGDLHGFENTGTVDFEYISVTSPPVNFREAYKRDWR
jgi:mannose-6-phosphate isomerase-like protein (cupin superfamily)